MHTEEEGKIKASQIEAMQNRNGIDNWPFPQPRGWAAQWDPEGLANAIDKNVPASGGVSRGDTISPEPCDKSDN